MAGNGLKPEPIRVRDSPRPAPVHFPQAVPESPLPGGSGSLPALQSSTAVLPDCVARLQSTTRVKKLHRTSVRLQATSPHPAAWVSAPTSSCRLPAETSAFRVEGTRGTPQSLPLAVRRRPYAYVLHGPPAGRSAQIPGAPLAKAGPCANPKLLSPAAAGQSAFLVLAPIRLAVPEN